MSGVQPTVVAMDHFITNITIRVGFKSISRRHHNNTVKFPRKSAPILTEQTIKIMGGNRKMSEVRERGWFKFTGRGEILSSSDLHLALLSEQGVMQGRRAINLFSGVGVRWEAAVIPTCGADLWQADTSKTFRETARQNITSHYAVTSSHGREHQCCCSEHGNSIIRHSRLTGSILSDQPPNQSSQVGGTCGVLARRPER
ncbi:hypothetical protein Bbelb_353490 [Branchiostoma belcheri]|nr:hypothetical protein Bbelb_353490 [Branchiostoma belcheri]